MSLNLGGSVIIRILSVINLSRWPPPNPPQPLSVQGSVHIGTAHLRLGRVVKGMSARFRFRFSCVTSFP
jgi:hypothetical protein